MRTKVLAILVTVFCLIGCYFKPTEVSSEIFAMNTYISQNVFGIKAQQASDEVSEYIRHAESLFSSYMPSTDVARINENAGKSSVKVDSLTIDLLSKAKKYCEAANGSFDITIAPLTMLWGISGDNPTVPDNDSINQAIELINYNDVIIELDSVMLAREGMSIDVGGIAKGYICGGVREIYDKYEIDSALVSIGGNIIAYKDKLDKTPYTLGIRDPNGLPNDIVGKLKVSDTVVATTGGYERFFIKNGVTYHHIIDPKTGYPSESDLLSVTAISTDGTLSDFLSTTLFMAGSEHIDTYLNNNKFDVIVIDNQNKVYISNNIKDKFELTNSAYFLEDLNGT